MSFAYVYNMFNENPDFRKKVEEDPLHDRHVQIFCQADPTTSRKYTKWVLNQYQNTDCTLADIDIHMNRCLEKFESMYSSNKIRIDRADINRFTGLFGEKGLMDFLQENGVDEDDLTEPEFFKTNKPDYSSNHTAIYKIKHAEDLIELSKGTNWFEDLDEEEAISYIEKMMAKGTTYYIRTPEYRYYFHWELKILRQQDEFEDENPELINDLVAFFKGQGLFDNYDAILKYFETLNIEVGTYLEESYEWHKELIRKGYGYDHTPIFDMIIDVYNKTGKITAAVCEDNLLDYLSRGVNSKALLESFEECIDYSAFLLLLDYNVPIVEYLKEHSLKIHLLVRPDHLPFVVDKIDESDCVEGMLWCEKLSDSQLNKILRNVKTLSDSTLEYIKSQWSRIARIKIAKAFPSISFADFMMPYYNEVSGHLNRPSQQSEGWEKPLHFGDQFYNGDFEYVEPRVQHKSSVSFYKAYAISKWINRPDFEELVKKYDLTLGFKLLAKKIDKGYDKFTPQQVEFIRSHAE